MAFLHPRTTMCTFYKHSQSQADLSQRIGDPHWDAATGTKLLVPGLSIGLPQTLKLLRCMQATCAGICVSVLLYVTN